MTVARATAGTVGRDGVRAMLVLKREVGGEVVVPAVGLRIVVLGVDRVTGSVRLGFEAPAAVAIWRGELRVDPAHGPAGGS